MIQTLLSNAAVYGAWIKDASYPVYLFGSVGVGNLRASVIVSAAVAVLFGLLWVLLSRSFLQIATSTGKVCEENQISIQDAEELVINTIKISKETSKLQKGFWGSILGIFGIIIVLLCILLLRDGKIVMYSVASIVTGLIAWGIPIIDRVFLKTHYVRRTMLVSVGFAFLSVWIQFLDIKNLAYTGNWSAIRDTINVLSAVVIMFCIITLLLNFINIKTHD